jgi:hypothetical protein
MASNVGIGVSNPKLPLDVNGDIRTTSNIYAMNRLGIGMSNPAYPLDVTGDINFTGTFRQNGIPYIGSQWSNSDSNVFLLGSNVGIGKSNPATPLDVAGTITATTFAGPTITSLLNLGWYGSNTANFGSNTAVTATATAVSGCNAAVFSSNLSVWSSNNLLNKAGGTITGSLDVTSNVRATSNVYAMTRLGVGTSNPTVPLHVIGDARIEGSLNVNGIFNTINTDVQVTDQFTVSNNGTGPALKVHQMGAQPIADFFDDSNIAVRFADGGNVGIGLSNPSHKLDVNGSIATPNCLISTWFGQDVVMWSRQVGSPSIGNRFLRVDQGGTLSLNALSNASIQLAIQDVAKAILTSAGNFGINVASPSQVLHVGGNILATGDVTAYSDSRSKTNLEVISSSLEKVSQLTGYTYDFIDSNVAVDKTTKVSQRFTGILAQDLEQVLPEAVHRDQDGFMSVAYGNMAGLFVEAIKELKLEVQTLKERVRVLEEAAATTSAPRTRAKRTTKKATATAATE